MNLNLLLVVGLSTVLLVSMVTGQDLWSKRGIDSRLKPFLSFTVSDMTFRGLSPLKGPRNVEVDLTKVLERVLPRGWTGGRLLVTGYETKQGLYQTISFLPSSLFIQGMNHLPQPILYMGQGKKNDASFQTNEIFIDTNQDGINGNEERLDVWFSGWQVGTLQKPQTSQP